MKNKFCPFRSNVYEMVVKLKESLARLNTLVSYVNDIKIVVLLSVDSEPTDENETKDKYKHFSPITGVNVNTQGDESDI